MKKHQNEIEFALLRLIVRMISAMSHKWALFSGEFIGLLIYYVIPIRKKVSIDNISRAFPQKTLKEVKQIAKNTYRNFGLEMVEFARLPQTTPEFLKKNVHFENIELLKRLYNQGNGAICMSGHFGNWEIMAAAIQAMGIPLMLIAKEQRNKFVDEYINNIRLSVGIETMQIGMALRGIIRALKEKKFIAMLADQDAHRDGVFVDFLGRPSSTATGPAIFALKTGAPIIFGSSVRGKNGKHTVHLELIDHSDLNGLTPENIRILTQRHASVLESSIKKWPDHWFWMHKRWKTRPLD